MRHLARPYLALIASCFIWGAYGCVPLSGTNDLGEYPWVADLLRPSETLSDISSNPRVRASRRDSVDTEFEADRDYWYTLTVQSVEDSLVGRTLRVVVSSGVARIDHEFRWLLSPLAGDRGRIQIAGPFSVDRVRQVINLVAPSLELGEYITSVRPAESVEKCNGEYVTVFLPNTIDVFVSRGVMEAGRILSVESVEDSVRVFQRGVIMH